MAQTSKPNKNPQGTHGGKRTGAGRPPIPDSEKHKRRTLRFTDEQWDTLKEQAEAEGLDRCEYVRIKLGLQAKSTPTSICENCEGSGTDQ